MTGPVTLADLQGALALLDVRCTRCGRQGRLRLVRLITLYGKDARLPDVRHRLSAIVRPGPCPTHPCDAKAEVVALSLS